MNGQFILETKRDLEMKGVVSPLGSNMGNSDWFPGHKKRDPFYILKTYFSDQSSHLYISLHFEKQLYDHHCCVMQEP